MGLIKDVIVTKTRSIQGGFLFSVLRLIKQPNAKDISASNPSSHVSINPDDDEPAPPPPPGKRKF